jgi:DNA-binding CsgD family transcriptional regulator/PAS domain-containing protein
MRESGQLLELIGLVYDAAVEPAGWTACLTALGRALHAPAIGLFPVTPGSLSTRASLCVGHGPEFLARYDAYYGRPEVNAYMQATTPDRLVPGVVVRAEAVIPDRELRRTEYFADWLRPQGIGAGAFAILRSPGGAPLVLSVARSPALGHLDMEELALLRVLVPHLERALALDRHLERLDAERQASEATLDLLAVGVILVDGSGLPVLLNRRADALVKANDGLGLDRDGLRGATPEATGVLRGLIAEAGRTSRGRGTAAGGALVLPRPSGRRPLAALVTPIARERWRPAVAMALAAVIVSDPDDVAAPPTTQLRRLWGLTPAEATLAREVVAGRNLKDAAEGLGVSVVTARSQLARVFAKTGTDRQAELVRMLATALPTLLAP